MACTAAGCGQGELVEVRTMEAQPEGTVTLNVEVVGAREATVGWNAPALPYGVIVYNVNFRGLYYHDPDNYDYTTVTEVRSLYETEAAQQGVVITGLIPASVYFVFVNASNSAGYLISNNGNELRIDMPMGSPDGILPPALTSVSPTVVQAVWQPAVRPNANEQVRYQLQFREPTPGYIIEDMFAQPTTSTSFIKSDLQPHTTYELRVVGINSFGDTVGDWASITTTQSVPVSVPVPLVSNIQSRSLILSWSEPAVPNGAIVEYIIYMNDNQRDTVPGNMTTLLVDNLQPFSLYQFELDACTIVGCTRSPPTVTIRTEIAPPEGVRAPAVQSQSPTQVLIVWAEPEYVNGELIMYVVQRRRVLDGDNGDGGDDDGIESVGTVPASADQLQYVDASPEVLPYTTYQYRIMVSTDGGQGYSDWTQVTTMSSSPAGVQSPTASALNATSVSVAWLPPIRNNGPLQYYVVKLPIPQIQVTDLAQHALVVTGLQPFTQYSVTITACTDAGCTESTPTQVFTTATEPDDLSPPTATPHSQSYVFVLWQPPQQPNGPNIRYDLARTKLRQPLDSDGLGFGSWLTIYSGTELFYEDVGLTIFTTYQYRVTAYNDFGLVVSDPSVEVTTFGGTPTESPELFAEATSHVTIEASWVTPDTQALQGAVDHFLLRVQSADTDTTLQIPSHHNSTTVDNLDPNTLYSLLLTIITHGNQSVSSTPVTVMTRDGAPQGLAAPLLRGESDTSMRVIWSAPSEPNGEIIRYNLLIDDSMIETGESEPGSYLVTGLAPYTVYSVKVECCTTYGCTISDATRGTTTEAIPEGLRAPTVTVQTPNTALVEWTPPDQENGIIVDYKLMRKHTVSCHDNPGPTAPPLHGPSCGYVSCLRAHSMCGSQCYTGQQVCCAGALYDTHPQKECCGRLYVTRRSHPQQICCGGVFTNPLDNHQCCGGRYTEVLEGNMCCVDTRYDRVSVGYGTGCCAGVPYDIHGPQICCNGILSSRYGYQCCGGRVVADTDVCCGDEQAGAGAAYSRDSSMECCGTDYVPTDRAVCCTDHNGVSKAHVYSSVLERMNSNEKCCGSERTSAQLSCCNNVGYNSDTQICADVTIAHSSPDVAGCGHTGTVCELEQRQNAFCNRCDFDYTQYYCGTYPTSDEGGEGDARGGTNDQEGEGDEPQGHACYSDMEMLYQGFDFRYQDIDLLAYTEYHYHVVVSNGAGSLSSEESTARTLESIPQGLEPPQAHTLPNNHYTIMLTWQPPTQPNGIIIRYQLIRNEVEIWRTEAGLAYTDTDAIQPYQSYTYHLRACTAVGCGVSSEVTVSTLQQKPEDVTPPVASSITHDTIQLVWSEPARPNGLITQYHIHVMENGFSVALGGTVLEFLLTDLEPFTDYSIILEACTGEGCTNSTETLVSTQEGRPQGLAAPTLVATSSTTLEIYWSEPASPNGRITSYTVQRSNTLTVGYTDVYRGMPSELKYTHRGLIASVTYFYRMTAYNSAGAEISEPTAITMPANTPEGISAPDDIVVLGAREIYVEWSEARIPNGVIDEYRVVLNSGTAGEIVHGAGLELFTNIANLTPYTQYKVRIAACVHQIYGGCGMGPASTATTHQAEPMQQPPPQLTASGPSSVVVTWQAPLQPNGVITGYRVNRRRAGQTGVGLYIHGAGGTVYSYDNIDPAIRPYTQYQYRITAVNAEGETYSEWSTVRTQEAPPQELADPTITNIDAYSMRVTWTPPAQPNGVLLMYQIQYTESGPVVNDGAGESGRQELNLPPDLDPLEARFSGLTSYTDYDVRIIAANSAGEAVSRWISGTTAQSAPADLGSFNVEKLDSGTSVILRWSPPGQPNGQIINYLIYEKDNLTPIYQGTVTVYQYTRLQPYTTYHVLLEACTFGGCGRSDMQTFTTAEVAPENQPAPVFSDMNSTHVVLRWSKPVNAHGKILRYQVLRRSESLLSATRGEGEVPLRRRRALSDPIVVHDVTDTEPDTYSFTDTNLQPYTHYQYSITAENSMGMTQSEWVSVETEPAAPTGQLPPIVSQIGSHYDQLRITWSPPNQPNGILTDYLLRRDNSVPWSIPATSQLEFIDQGLTAYTVYSYTVSACTIGGCSTSDSVSQRTPETAPLSVSPPTVRAVSATAILAIWTTPQITNGELQNYVLLVDGNERYTGLDLEYTTESLVPYQLYQFILRACTAVGCTESAPVSGRPDEASPGGMQPPTLTVTSSTSIEVTWRPPDYPNGVITSYEVSRDNELKFSTMNQLMFIDRQVEPGRRYSYRVTAFNSRGRVMSPIATATTYASSPAGINPPILTPTSSSSVRATWSPPAFPNGEIFNYTLYRGGEVEYTGGSSQLTTEVGGLSAYTEYTFRIEACTLRGCTMSDEDLVRTHPAPPQGMSPPSLQAYFDGIQVEWSQPTHPNGVIRRYTVYRRLATTGGGGSQVQLIVTTSLTYHDLDSALLSDTDYQYAVEAANDRGIETSDWATVTTIQKAPTVTPPPEVVSTTTSTITIRLLAPTQPNGAINRYEIYLDGEMVRQTLSGTVTLGQNTPLAPYTQYNIHVSACTGGGCTASEVITATTDPDRPSGMAAPLVVNVTDTTVQLEWGPPHHPNGEILSYQLRSRRSCPYPYADATDAFRLSCTPSPWTNVTSQLTYSYTVGDLEPYTTYQYQVIPYNGRYGLYDVNHTTVTTLTAAPTYRTFYPPTVDSTTDTIIVDWSDSFKYNGEVVGFVLERDGEKQYEGVRTMYSSARDDPTKSYEFQILLTTNVGTVSSPLLYFVPGEEGLALTPLPATAAPSSGSDDDDALYDEVWFIILLIIVGILLVVLCLILCMRYSGSPYIRERSPLHHQHRKTHSAASAAATAAHPSYPVDSYTGGLIQNTVIPDGASSSITPPPHHTLPHVGYVNPALSHVSAPGSRATSRPVSMMGSLVDINLDQVSQWDNEEDDDIEDTYLPWDGQVPNIDDSGMHSIGYGEDFDPTSEKPVSYIKEHHTFTDTHL